MKHYSKQREAILEVLRSTDTHPTANWIYEKVREKIPNISLGTVYRNLNLLSENGTILKISLEDDSAHFDGFTHQHLHFFCNKCRSLKDIEPKEEDMKSFIKIASKYFDGDIESQVSVFYGTCGECKCQ